MPEPDGATITPDQIDHTFVPRPLAAVDQVLVGDELVLLEGWRSASVVGPVGQLIWGGFDGATTLGSITTGLAQATGADPEVVQRDVVAFTVQMGEAGFLDGVRPPGPDGFELELVAIHALAVGDVVDDTEVRALQGDTADLADLRGRSVLLVNWSPHCGYCGAIADLLAALAQPLEQAGIVLVLLASGDEATNREVADAAGFVGPVLLREGDVDPFRAYGTPCAYHLDGDGRLVAPMANGAEAVLDLASELAGVDAHSLLADPDADPVPAGTRYLLTDGSCAPVSGDEPRVRWSGTRVYRVGDHHVGVRHDTDEAAEVLDALFPGQGVRDRRAGHSYAVALQLPEAADGAPDSPASSAHDFRLLVAGGVPLVRSRYPSRVLRALLWRLADDTLGYATDPGRLRVQATAALVDGMAVLLPSQLHVFGPSIQARLARIGLAVADPPFPEIDLATAELVIPVPAVDHDPTVLDGLDRRVQTGAELPPVGPGRYPLLGWGVLRPGDRSAAPFSPGEAAAATLSLVYETDDAPSRVRELGELFTRIPGFGVWYQSEAGLVDAVAQGVQAVRNGSAIAGTDPW